MAKKISDANLFSFSEIDRNSLLNISSLDFSQQTISFDINFGKDAMAIMNFDIDLGDSFSLASFEFNSDLLNDGFLVVDNYDEFSNHAYFSGISFAENLYSKGDHILNIELSYNGEKDIIEEFLKLKIENISLSNEQQSELSIVGVNSTSDNMGVFSDLLVNEGVHEFHLEKQAYFEPSAIVHMMHI